MATRDVLALALSIPLLVAVSFLYDASVLRWSEKARVATAPPPLANPSEPHEADETGR
jgi:hypothetical protein